MNIGVAEPGARRLPKFPDRAWLAYICRTTSLSK